MPAPAQSPSRPAANTPVLTPELFVTPRLFLRRPVAADAPAIFRRYASDPAATRWLSWPRHSTLDETLRFIDWSDSEWARWPVGPLLVFERDRCDESRMLGATGLCFTSPTLASTGYVLAPDAWGRGYATEILCAVVSLAGACGLLRLEALCQAGHTASVHVLEKCGFIRVALLPRHLEFPNAAPGERLDVLKFARALG